MSELRKIERPMPIVEDLQAEELDPDDIRKPVVTVGVSMVTDGVETSFHRHRKAQLLFAMRGVLTCEADSGLWIVPPQCAVWIPAGVTHNVKGMGSIEGYNVFIRPDQTPPSLPSTCCTVSVTPLLRELLVRSAAFPAHHPEGRLESRLSALLLDELDAAPVEKLHLPMPADDRLRRIATMIMSDPSDRASIATWARRVGLSERTLARTLVSQTGMSFGRWRQQLYIVLALQWLGQGASIQRVAADLGYENAGSFVTMFRKTLGSSPGRYMAGRRELS